MTIKTKSREQIEAAFAGRDELLDHIKSIARAYADATGLSYKRLCFSGVADGEIECSWEDTWAYGGYEGGSITFPMAWLWDNNHEAGIRSVLDRMAAEKAEADDRERQRREAEEKATLAALLAKHGHPNEDKR